MADRFGAKRIYHRTVVEPLWAYQCCVREFRCIVTVDPRHRTGAETITDHSVTTDGVPMQHNDVLVEHGSDAEYEQIEAGPFHDLFGQPLGFAEQGGGMGM